MENENLYYHKLEKNNNVYFFQVSQSISGSTYVRISRRAKLAQDTQDHSIIIEDSDLDDFFTAFKKLVMKVGKMRMGETADKAYSVDQIRKSHGNAYMPWTADENRRLETLFKEGKTVKELSKIFERREGAIRSRIKKLGLLARPTNG